MNHPSDYMIHSHYSSSSDSSDTSFTQPPPPVHAKKSSQSFHHIVKEQKLSAKTKKGNIKSNKSLKKNGKNTKGEKQQKRSVSDYLILGNSYYPCKNAVQISHRLIQRQTVRIMKNDRVKNKEKKCISKIEKYIKTFLINNRKDNLFRSISHLQKIQLYQMLKQQQRKEDHQQNHLQQLMRTVVSTLETKADKLEALYPEHQQVVIKWKNFKLHQLMTAKMFIAKEQQNLPLEILDFHKQLPLLENAQFYPELKEQIIQLQESILNHIQHKYSNQNQEILEDEGLKWVLQKLLHYIQGKPDIHQQILQNLNQFHTNHSLNVPLLSDDLYINFQKEQIEKGDTEMQIEEHTDVHIFNKAIFDIVNQQFGPVLETMTGQVNEKSLQWLFSKIKIRQKQIELPSQALLWVDQVIFDVLLEQSLWEFLDLL